MGGYKKYFLATAGWTLFFLGVIWMIRVAMPVVEERLANVSSLLAGVFAVTVSADDLSARYLSATGTVKILIVPGHDNEYSGTSFAGKREADLVLKIGEALAEELAQDKKLEVVLARDPITGGYNQELTDYMKKEKSSIEYFIRNKRQKMLEYLSQGEVNKNVKINHNTAASGVVFRLYAINKWSNENEVDVLIHLHLNDDPTRNVKKGLSGKYNGFAIYVPERQYGNAEASNLLAQSLTKQLNYAGATSTHPLEKGGIIEAQELIALGSNGSQDGASNLIEYGYIYEQRFLDPDRWQEEIKTLSKLTAQGLRDYLAKR